MKDLKRYIREIPDFPKKGILFRDITTLLKNSGKFREVIDELAGRYSDKGIDAVVAVESRGFIFGSALAYKLGAAFVPIRKKGKLPFRTFKATYTLEYGEDTLEIHEDAFSPGSNVLLVDDLLATGGTLGAVVDLVKKLKGRIHEAAFIIELSDLKGREKLKNIPVYSTIKY
ncbi:MAG TPA: adenine phosphoribosyltransferase [Candidatus Omnitrophica bacterium]|nr:adenine phosphoribosyltransferase [Candidatus Omnitrophota bacterium]